MKATLLKGFHYMIAIPTFIFDYLPFFKFSFAKWQIAFSKECLYHFNTVDDQDLNKLIGVSAGYHMKDSFRIGWRPKNNKIELYTYIHQNGIRIKEEKFFEVNIDEIFTVKMSRQNLIMKIMVQYGTKLQMYSFPLEGLPSWGYYLYPYFGGNMTAPHTMSINIAKVN